MKSPKFLPKLKKPKLLVRRVVGDSMLPTLRPGQIVVGHGFYRKIKPGDVVIIRHSGLEKIKRVARIEDDTLFVLGDNARVSTDSRDFGWVPKNVVYAKLIWPRK